MTEIEKLEYKNLKLRIENERLKKGYTSKEADLAIIEILSKDYNIKRSMSRQGTPTDNPIIESLKVWIKEELVCKFNLHKM